MISIKIVSTDKYSSLYEYSIIDNALQTTDEYSSMP
jgi:hypothetical protein